MLFSIISMSLSAFIPSSIPLKNNYIPVIIHPLFFIGLALFTASLIVQITAYLWTSYDHFTPFPLALLSTSFIIVIALICFALSYRMIPTADMAVADYFYEHLFWGGGHVIQYVYTNLLFIAWIWLAHQIGLPILKQKLFIILPFIINLLLCLPLPSLYFIYDEIESLTPIFTTHMRHGGGVAVAILAAGLIIAAAKGKTSHNTLRSGLLLSILLFTIGGMMGFMIQGMNVTVPAHYHGQIIGITIAFMTVIYHFLPQCGYQKVGRLAHVQLYIYGLGQLTHITGLAWMGGYGALRKDAGSTAGIDTIMGKTLFFTGGSLAIIGGLLFVVIALISIMKKR